VRHEGAAVPVNAPNDMRARERALRAEESFLVRAPAGSGKTELLIQRLLVQLARVRRPEAVLALTFSRKAAGEMRERLLQALESGAGPEPALAHQRRTWELARAVLQQGHTQGWNLRQSPSRLQVMTLDALALHLVQRMPWMSRFGAAPRPTESAEELYRAAARAALHRVEGGRGADAAGVLLRQGNADMDRVAALLADLLARRDQWMGWLGEASRAGLEREFADRIGIEIAAIRAAVPPELQPPTDDAPGWRTLAHAALTLNGTVRANWRGAKPDAAGCAALAWARGLPDPAMTPAAWEAVEALLQLLPLAVAELQLVFRDAGRCDFTEVTLAAGRALGGADAPTALAFEMDGRLEHLFVDEFQDTSRAQHQLLQALVADWSANDGRTLFLVGDPMQSIYGFRNAQVGLFLDAAERQQFGALPLTTLDLTANYRSQAGLVAWYKQTFGHRGIAADRDDSFLGTTRFVAAAAVRAAEAGPAVRVHALPGHNPQFEAVRVAQLAREEAKLVAAEAKRPAIAILVQSRSHLDALLPELRRQGIAYQGVQLHPLGQEPVILDLLALTRALQQPADRTAWLAVLRAPWCGLTLRDLHALCADRPHATLAELAAEAGRLDNLSEDGRQRLQRVRAALAPAEQQRGRVALRAWIEWCWQALGGDELATPAERRHAARYLDLLESFDQSGRGADIFGLQREMAGMRADSNPDGDATVVVMTAHQAKGLEFDTVILPGLDRAPRQGEPELLRWIEARGGASPRWLLAPRPETGGADAHYDLVGELRQRQSEREQLRLLYVAATRARRRLHIVAHFPTSRSGTALAAPARRAPLARIWPALGDEFARQYQEMLAAPPPEVAEAPAASPPRLQRVPTKWPGPGIGAGGGPPASAPDSAATFTAERERLRGLGTAVHAMLQQLAERAPGTPLAWDPRRLRAALWAAGVPEKAMADAMAHAGGALDRVLQDARGRWVLEPHAEARCEWALTGLVNGVVEHRIVDRSFVDEEGARWIVDYKLVRAEADLEIAVESYRQQLAVYADLIAGLEPDRRIRCGLYFALQAAWREVEFRL